MPAGGSELRFECPTCRKSFCSAMGLGSHKKAHPRGAVSSVVERPESSGTAAPELQIITHTLHRTAHPCPICQEAWPSLRSLCGHMKKHRDRDWRGMNPPTTPDAAPLLLEGSERPRCHGKAPTEMIREAGEESTRPKKKQKVEAGAVVVSGGCSQAGNTSLFLRKKRRHKSHHNLNADAAAAAFGFDLNELPPPEERGDGGWIIGEEASDGGCFQQPNN